MRLSSLELGAAAAPPSSDSASAMDEAYSIELSGATGAACVPGKAAKYTWTLAHAGTGAPVTDLQPYLAAAMHLAVVSLNLTSLEHVHGVARAMGSNVSSQSADSMADGGSMHSMGDSDAHASHGRKLLAPGEAVGEDAGHGSGSSAHLFGPDVYTGVTFPAAGTYALIGQLRRGDRLILAPFYLQCGA